MIDTCEVSAVIPVYNDRAALIDAIPASLHYLEEICSSFELLVAEDGSDDGSAELVAGWEERDSRVRLLHADERLGRGRALTRAFRESKGDIFCYYDVDLATDMSHLGDLIQAIRSGFDIATGSRLMPDSRIDRDSKREIASRGYNMLVRFILGSRLYDHQCGFKAFSRNLLLDLLPAIRAPHWFWDTELLVRAQRGGYHVCEFPVTWQQGAGTTVQLSDVTGMGSEILRLWWRLHAEKD
ncbi:MULTISPECIES: dolichyl-phosphate beta-glucosyltransferase [Methanocalculus]|uniref:dolichyl-phosphate beta-glucosyltransferase n=1 Tax=Methanocalculus TaxID=71151 RepID=UPI0020A0C70E|nr:MULTISPECIES: dolichyl-phosphate beta-glucosyltransferase [unclassified Methanocalculus]